MAVNMLAHWSQLETARTLQERCLPNIWGASIREERSKRRDSVARRGATCSCGSVSRNRLSKYWARTGVHSRLPHCSRGRQAKADSLDSEIPCHFSAHVAGHFRPFGFVLSVGWRGGVISRSREHMPRSDSSIHCVHALP